MSCFIWNIFPITHKFFHLGSKSRCKSLFRHLHVKEFSQIHRMTISTNNQRKIRVNNLDINMEKVGIGGHPGHPVLCLPGALGSIDSDFRPQLAEFDESKFTIVAMDPVGYGKSRPPNRDFSEGAQMFYRDARIAQALMKELKLEPFSILGWSDGGITGMIMAALFPDSILKMVIWGANSYVGEKDMAIYKSIENVDKWSPKMKAPMIEMYGDKGFRELWSDWVNVYSEIYKNGGDICNSELEKIKCPTLIIHGDQDVMVGMEHPQHLLKNITNSTLTIWEDGKHNLHLRHFKRFNTLVQKFLLN